MVLALGPCGSGAAQAVDARIDALNASSDMVLVAAPASVARALEPAVWARAAYLVELAEGASAADAWRAALGEVLSRGRDAALVTWLDGEPFTGATASAMVARYAAAGGEVWAVEAASGGGKSVLLGRDMMERLLRTTGWQLAEEVLRANAAHVVTLTAAD
ncbi:MAG: hypothetical protein P4M01_13775 [Acidobacteriota bacterium]|nr:hypothetical protein [Acidobacteriota bacterium]